MILTYRYRVKSHLGQLNRQVRAVNFVWNFCNDRQRDALRWSKKWPTAYDLQKLCAGASKELGLLATTIDKVCVQYERSRRQFNRPHLRYRGRRSLGWIPVRAEALREAGDAFRFGGTIYRVFKSRQLPSGAKIKEGSSFSQDARGNWFLNVVVELPDAPVREISSGVGIDLGLKEFAALSTGEVISNPRHFRALEGKLAVTQRGKKKRAVVKIHAKVAATRKDFLHKLSTRIVREFDYIAVGNVNAAALAKTKMAKSVNDASWSDFRRMLAYKSIASGRVFQEVDERFSSQTCSSCGTLPDSRPKGIVGLGIRAWTCSDCGAVHDRDVNAATNILRAGHRTPVEGIGAAIH